MTEPDRLARNASRLVECHPRFRTQLRRVLDRLEAESFRPRIQHAWRSTAEQKTLRAAGMSKLSWGFHNCTAEDGTPESLAADVLDDNNPLNPPVAYLVRLGAIAREEGLSTGIDWGLPAPLKLAVRNAMTTGTVPEGLKVSWDPCHVEVTGISVQAARNGARPIAEDTGERLA